MATPISRIASNRVAIYEFVLIAGLFGLAINLLASAIAIAISVWFVSVTAALVALVVTGWVWHARFGKTTSNYTFRGCFGLNAEGNGAKELLHYDFSRKAGSYLRSAFSENTALQAQWLGEPLSEVLRFDNKTKQVVFKQNAAHKLLLELVEYYVLQELSIHLTDHFADRRDGKIAVVEYSRNDLPEVLLRNRFLDMFSKDPRDRPIFDTKEHDDSVVTAYGPKNAYYSRFDLTLPVGSTLQREQDGVLSIITPVMTIQISPEFNATTASLPHQFVRLMSTGETVEDGTFYNVELRIKVTRKFMGVLLHGRPDQLDWIDSFLRKLRRRFDYRIMLRNLNWPLVSLLLEATERRARLLRDTSSS